jgi:hypothetical protein
LICASLLVCLGYGVPVPMQQSVQDASTRIRDYIKANGRGEYGVALATLSSALQISADHVR